jgi:hypothetical protein
MRMLYKDAVRVFDAALGTWGQAVALRKPRGIAG